MLWCRERWMSWGLCLVRAVVDISCRVSVSVRSNNWVVSGRTTESVDRTLVARGIRGVLQWSVKKRWILIASRRLYKRENWWRLGGSLARKQTVGKVRLSESWVSKTTFGTEGVKIRRRCVQLTGRIGRHTGQTRLFKSKRNNFWSFH